MCRRFVDFLLYFDGPMRIVFRNIVRSVFVRRRTVNSFLTSTLRVRVCTRRADGSIEKLSNKTNGAFQVCDFDTVGRLQDSMANLLETSCQVVNRRENIFRKLSTRDLYERTRAN